MRDQLSANGGFLNLRKKTLSSVCFILAFAIVFGLRSLARSQGIHLPLIGFVSPLVASIIIVPLLYFLKKGRLWKQVLLILGLLFYGVVVYAFNFKFLADKMFYQPENKLLLTAAAEGLTGADDADPRG